MRTHFWCHQKAVAETNGCGAKVVTRHFLQAVAWVGYTAFCHHLDGGEGGGGLVSAQSI